MKRIIPAIIFLLMAFSLAACQKGPAQNEVGTNEANIENARGEDAALKADLVILPGKLKDAAASLEELGLKVILVNPENTQDLYEAITIIASSTGTGARGDELIKAMEKMYTDLSALTTGAGSPPVYMAGNSAFLSTAGAKMYQSAMIDNAGGTNAAAQIEDSYWSDISYELLLDWNPEYIVIAAEAQYTVDDVLSDSSISECSAVKNGNVYKMPDDIEAWDSPVPGGVLGSV